MKMYVENEIEGRSHLQLLNSDFFNELYIMNYRFIAVAFRKFLHTLTVSTDTYFDTIVNLRTAAFVIFVIAVILAYLTLWLPLINTFNREVKHHA